CTRSPDTRAEDDADPVGVRGLEASVVDGHPAGGDREVAEAVQALHLLRNEPGSGVEVLDLACDLHGMTRRVERANRSDAGTAGEERVPEAVECGADRRHHTQASDRHAAPGAGCDSSSVLHAM